ncbi:MAG: hypothetical protein M3Z57_08185 [Candidatus Dormibacteraeota bacterium]|nr:hypothetical protein [Candidatus Dormibacteraeota bacterium]
MLTPRRRKSESGQVLLITGLVFVFVLFGLIAVVGDLLTLSNAAATARDAAFLGAQAGGSDVDIASAASTDVPSSGTLTLSQTAVTDCQQAAAATDPGITVTCTVSGGRISVAVSQDVELPIQLFGRTATVSAQAQGGPAAGTVTAR